VAAMENTEAEGKELERRAKRYWTLRHLEASQTSRPLAAIVTREGISAELTAFAIRGALRGGSNLPAGSRILAEIVRIDPLRGTLTLSYRGPDLEAGDADLHRA